MEELKTIIRDFAVLDNIIHNIDVDIDNMDIKTVDYKTAIELYNYSDSLDDSRNEIHISKVIVVHEDIDEEEVSWYDREYYYHINICKLLGLQNDAHYPDERMEEDKIPKHIVQLYNDITKKIIHSIGSNLTNS